MVRNPPAYFIMTGRSAVVVPYDDIATLYKAAEMYNVRYIVLEKIGTPAQLADLYNQPENYSEFVYLGSIDENHIYFFNPSSGTAIK